MKDLIYSSGDLFGGKTPIGITNGPISLVECESSIADQIVIKHHYSHKATSNRFLSFLVNDGMGVLQLGYGIRPTMKHTISEYIKKGNFCEFDRMWLSDEMPKFSESQVIALLLSYLKQTRREIKFVITYADESAGNTGIIYRATNAFELDPIECSFYLLPSGERIHPVSMYHRHKTRTFATIEKIYPGIVRIRGDRIQRSGEKSKKSDNPVVQRRFLYILDNKLRRRVQRNFVRSGKKIIPDSAS